MQKNKIHDPPHTNQQRKELRKKLTPAEAFLWIQLQGQKFMGRKFRRQHGIENYIVDFYCAQEKLIVELDGSVHMNPAAAEKDQKRNERLTELGFTVIRFENKMVFEKLPSVLTEIKDNFLSKT